jgi:hypothetical protein
VPVDPPYPQAGCGGRLRSCASGQRTGTTLALFLDIAQGAGLAGATGVRPFLPPLLAGALARGDIGVDFEQGSFSFLEHPAFLLLVLALAVGSYAAERARPAPGREGGRDPVAIALAAMAVALGALLFAGSLTEGGISGWPGLAGGAACAALGYVAAYGLLARARRRVDPGAAALLPAYGDVVALVLAAVAVFVPPVSLLALAAFVFLIVRGRRRERGKYEGLRILR